MGKDLDVFDSRSQIGAKLEAILSERSLTKSELCKNAHVSRPTLDRLLSAEITNKTTYEKHLTKVLSYLKLTPDMLIGSSANTHNRIRLLKETLRLDAEGLSKESGLSVKRLEEIELGSKAEVSELRDIAFALRTSVRSMLGENYFPTQVSSFSFGQLKGCESERGNQVGFWGHIGILPIASKEYQWYPITGNTCDAVSSTINNKYIIVPCMNNKVLLVNTEKISNIILLDDGCSEPEFCNCDRDSVGYGRTPLVVYETLNDYVNDDLQIDENNASKLEQHTKDLIDGSGEIEGFDELAFSQEKIRIFYSNGYIETTSICFLYQENISFEISMIYDYGDDEEDIHFLYYHNNDMVESCLNIQNISLIELPLLKIEDAICESLEEDLM